MHPKLVAVPRGDSDRPAVNISVPGYQLFDIIGEGASSIVFRGVQRSIGRPVAVKILRPLGQPGGQMEHRFIREAQIIGRLRHPHTIRLYDAGRTDNGALFLVTELLVGCSLADVIRTGPLALDRVLHLGTQVAGALSEAHEAGIIHRDIKPANIFLDVVGGEASVKVIDFGIAREEQSVHLTLPDVIVGSPGYMAPEQILGEEIDLRADIYALGVVLHNLLSGRSLFSATTIGETMAKHVSVPAPLLWRDEPNLDPRRLELQDLIRAMLEKPCHARPPSMSEVRRRLDIARAAPSEVPAYYPPPPSPPPSPPGASSEIKAVSEEWVHKAWFEVEEQAMADATTLIVPQERPHVPWRSGGVLMLVLALLLVLVSTLLAR